MERLRIQLGQGSAVHLVPCQGLQEFLVYLVGKRLSLQVQLLYLDSNQMRLYHDDKLVFRLLQVQTLTSFILDGRKYITVEIGMSYQSSIIYDFWPLEGQLYLMTIPIQPSKMKNGP